MALSGLPGSIFDVFWPNILKIYHFFGTFCDQKSRFSINICTNFSAMSFPISAYRTNSHTNKQPPALLQLLIPPHQPRCKGVSDQYAWLSGMLMARIAAGPSSSVPRFLDVPKVRRSVRSTWNTVTARESMVPWALGWHSWPPLGPSWPFWNHFCDPILLFQAMWSYFCIKKLFQTSLGTLFYKKYSKRYLQNPEKPWKTIEKPWFFNVFQGFTIFVFWPVLWRFFAPK